MTDLAQSPPFERIVLIDILGLAPGSHTLSVNGIETVFTIPMTQAEALTSVDVPVSDAVRDEMVDIEDLILDDPVPSSSDS